MPNSSRIFLVLLVFSVTIFTSCENGGGSGPGTDADSVVDTDTDSDADSDADSDSDSDELDAFRPCKPDENNFEMTEGADCKCARIDYANDEQGELNICIPLCGIDDYCPEFEGVQTMCITVWGISTDGHSEGCVIPCDDEDNCVLDLECMKNTCAFRGSL